LTALLRFRPPVHAYPTYTSCQYIIDYLRDGTIPLIEDRLARQQFRHEAIYFMLYDLADEFAEAELDLDPPCIHKLSALTETLMNVERLLQVGSLAGASQLL